MSLNIEYSKCVSRNDPVEDKYPAAYRNPVGIWEVSTEGDCEGRTTKELGRYEGHVARIAFFLADKAHYGLKFKPVLDYGILIPDKIITNRKYVWVRFGADSKTYNLSPTERAEWFANFLNAKDEIEVHGVYDNAEYYASLPFPLATLSSCLVLLPKKQ
jgi:hypothetical protein